MLALALALSLGGLVSDAPPPFSATLLSQADTQFVPPPVANQVYRDPQLRLDELRAMPNPSLGGGIALLVTGIVGIGVGIVFGIYGAAFLFGASLGGSVLTAAAVTFLAIASVGLAVGITLTIVGAALLSKASKTRRERSQEIKRLEQEVRQQQQWQQRQVAPPILPPPPPGNYVPPPPPPPSTFLQNVEPTLLLAEF
jgi:hypothetical protein